MKNYKTKQTEETKKQTRKSQGKIIWTASAVHVNIETGEIITKEQSKKLLYVTTKHFAAITNQWKTRGHIQYIHEYRPNPQRNLFD